MQLHQLRRSIANKKGRRVGRGGSREKPPGRGPKGQKARAGHKIMPAIREILKKLPKRRGYRLAAIGEKPLVVNIGSLERFFAPGDSITPRVLAERGLVRAPKGERVRVKILGDGTLTKKLVISGCELSARARAAVQKAGGSIS